MNHYLTTFFAEKNLPIAIWELKDKQGNTHTIDSEVVIESIGDASIYEQDHIGSMIRQIDFKNGDVLDYLEHLAHGLINRN